ncbi:MAG: hypothetical protein ACSLE6_02885 [Mycobacterium sp.]
MTSTPVTAFEVAERSDHVEVRGVSRTQVLEALDLLERVRATQADRATAIRTDLVHTLMAANVPLMPPATLAQAQRLAAHRDALLAAPVLTHETLREIRGDTKESSTRTWLSRRRDAAQLFTVSHDGRTLIPAFQLDGTGTPRPELQPILAALNNSGVQGWVLWTWLVSPTSLLSGEIPERLAVTAPQRVLRAAQRFAAPPAA